MIVASRAVVAASAHTRSFKRPAKVRVEGVHRGCLRHLHKAVSPTKEALDVITKREKDSSCHTSVEDKCRFTAVTSFGGAVSTAAAVASLRLEQGMTGRVTTFKEMLEATKGRDIPDDVKKNTRSHLTRRSRSDAVWMAWINIFACCRDWDDCVSELQSAISAAEVTLPIRQDDLWPVPVLQHAISLIGNAAQAEAGIAELSDRIFDLPSGSAWSLIEMISKLVLRDLNGRHLCRSITSLHLLHAGRLLQVSSHSDGGQYTVYRFLDGHICDLKDIRDDRARTEAMRVVRWAESRLHRDDLDRLRMRLLSITHTNAKRIKPLGKRARSERKAAFGADPDSFDQSLWDSVQWRLSASGPFANARMAAELLEGLYKNRRSGHSFTLAVRRALQIAALDRDSAASSSLQRLVSSIMHDKDRVDGAVLPSAEALRLLIKHGKEHEIWAIFHQLTQRPAGQVSPQVWSLMVLWLAGKSDVSPKSALELAEVGVDFVPKSPPRFHRPDVCSALLKGLNKRDGAEAYECVVQIWKEFISHPIEMDANILAGFFQAMVKNGDTGKALHLLGIWAGTPTALNPDVSEEEERVVRSVPPSVDVYNILMLTFLAQGESRRVYDLFNRLEAHSSSLANHHTLELILKAACDVSQYVYDGAGSYPLLSALLSRFSGEPTRQSGLTAEGIDWDGEHAALRARKIFLERLFVQHPELECLPLPAEMNGRSANMLFHGAIRIRNASGWLGSSIQPQQKDVSEKVYSRGAAPFNAEGACGIDRVQYAFSGWTFHQYLILLPHAETAATRLGRHGEVAWEERFAILAWMRALDVRPSSRMLCLLCMQLDEVLPPAADPTYLRSPRSTQWAAGPLNEYLAEWLGEDAVPTYGDVFRTVRKIKRRDM